MKKFAKVFCILILVCVLFASLVYLGLAYYYRDGFSYGTYINGVYCTGKSVDEVADILNAEYDGAEAVVHYGDKAYKIKLADIDYVFDYASPVSAFRDMQNPYLWPRNLLTSDSKQIMYPAASYDADSLRAIFDEWQIASDDLPYSVTLELTDEGYVIRDGKSEATDVSAAFDKIATELAGGMPDITIDDCKIAPIYTAEELRLFDMYKSIDAFQNKAVAYQFGSEKKVFDKSELAAMLATDESGALLTDEAGEVYVTKESLSSALEEILSPYNTYHNHKFRTHDGRYVYLDDGTYGNKFDIDAEVDCLYEALTGDEDNIVRIPEYSHEALYKGSDDIGPTYIEVSLDEQHLYYYEDGELVLDTDVVTGRKNHSGTPEMVCDVYFKQRNRTLVGETYRSFVNYWMAVYKAVGIHDASWRDEYGSDIYTHNGSHGCINTPIEKVSVLYDMVEIGTPVIIYSYENSGIDFE